MVLDGYLKKVKNPTEVEPVGTRITPKQRDILKLLAEGKTSKEIAVVLGMTVKTVDTHRSNIMRRLDCQSLSEIGSVRLTEPDHQSLSEAKLHVLLHEQRWPQP
jgi:DNA-binding CsgD family transcriptional regulator